MLAAELCRSSQVQEFDNIGPRRDGNARLAVWVDVGGFSRTRLSYVFSAEENHGIRWLAADALRVLSETPADRVM